MNEAYTKDLTSDQSANQIYLDSETLVVEVNGNQAEADIKYLDEEAIKLISSLGYKPNVLIDISRCGIPNTGARKLISDSFSRDDYNVQAIFGMNEGIKAVAQIILGKILLGDRTKLFNSKAEAIDWLNANPADKNNKPDFKVHPA